MCATSAAAASLQARSDIKGVSLVALATLPHSPEKAPIDEYCEGYRAKKLTAAGRQVAGLGWIVTSEASLGRYRVVTFASGFTPGTSALCFARNPNIAVFDGVRPVALAYGSRRAEGALGVVEPLESGALLIWGDPPGAPVGELRQEAGGLRLTAIAPQRAFCRGRAVVPNVYGKPLDAARRILIAHGWRPLRPSEKPGEFDTAADLARRGVVEAQTCSGTGVGYCEFKYRAPAGVLGLTTVGGEPKPADNTVVSYDVDCARK